MDLLFSMIFGSGFAVIIAIAGIAIFLCAVGTVDFGNRRRC